jgi:hypothetical protein
VDTHKPPPKNGRVRQGSYVVRLTRANGGLHGAGHGVAAPGPISRQYKNRRLNKTRVPKPALLSNEFQVLSDKPIQRILSGFLLFPSLVHGSVRARGHAGDFPKTKQ